MHYLGKYQGRLQQDTDNLGTSAPRLPTSSYIVGTPGLGAHMVGALVFFADYNVFEAKYDS